MKVVGMHFLEALKDLWDPFLAALYTMRSLDLICKSSQLHSGFLTSSLSSSVS